MYLQVVSQRQRAILPRHDDILGDELVKSIFRYLCALSLISHVLQITFVGFLGVLVTICRVVVIANIHSGSDGGIGANHCHEDGNQAVLRRSTKFVALVSHATDRVMCHFDRCRDNQTD